MSHSADMRPSWRDWRPWTGLAVPMVLAAAVLLRGISAVPLWIDELYTWKAVTSGFGETLGEPPYLPYYTVVWAFTNATHCTSEACLRLPSVIAMVAAVGLASAAAIRLFGPRAGAMAGLVLAMTPAVQRWGQDARPYALAAALVAASALCLVWAIQSNRRWAWVANAVAASVSIVVVPMTGGLLLATAVVVVLTPWGYGLPSRLRPWIVATLLPAVVAVLMIARNRAALAGTGGFHQDDIFAPRADDLLHMLTWPVTGNAFSSVSAGAVAMAVILLSLLTRQGAVWLAAAAAATSTLWLVSFVGASFWLGRFAVPFASLACIGVGAAFRQFGWRRSLVVLAVIGVAALPTYTENVLPWSRGYDWRTAMATVDSQWQAGDALVFADGMQPSAGWALDYYGSQELYPTTAVLNPNGRSWIINDQQPCPDGQVWELGYGNRLTLCSQGPD